MIEAEEAVAGVDEAVEAGLGEAEVLEELVAGVGVEESDFGFEGAADADDFGVFFGGAFFDGGGVGVAGGERGLVDVGDVEHGLGGDEVEVAGGGALVVGQVDGAGGLAGFEREFEFGDGGGFGFELGVLGVLGEFFEALRALFYGVEIGEQELGVDGVDVGQGVDAAGDVDDLGVVEAADDVRDGVGRPDVTEELVAEAFALRGAGDEAGDVDELHGGGDEGLGLDEGGDLGRGARRARRRCRRWGRWCRRGSSRPGLRRR